MRQRHSLFPCRACGSLVDWMSAARDTKDREEMTTGAACTHHRCTRKYKRGRYTEAQIRRLRATSGGGAHSVFRPTVAAGRCASETGWAAGGESHQAGSGEHMGSGAGMGKGKARATPVNTEHTAVCPESPSGQCFMPKCLLCTRHLTRCVFCDQQWIPYHLACSCDIPDCTSHEARCSAIQIPTSATARKPVRCPKE